MTDDRIFNEPKQSDDYIQGLTDALELIDGMVDANATIQAWNFVAKRAADGIRKMIRGG